MGVLMIWPTARSTALAGAMTGLADEADATFFNPAGLAFQTTAKADISYANWLPGLHPGMGYGYASGGAPLRGPSGFIKNLYVAGSLTYLSRGEEWVITERGETLDHYRVWRGAAGLHAAARLTQNLAVGLGAKLVVSQHAVWSLPEL